MDQVDAAVALSQPDNDSASPRPRDRRRRDAWRLRLAVAVPATFWGASAVAAVAKLVGDPTNALSAVLCVLCLTAAVTSATQTLVLWLIGRRELQAVRDALTGAVVGRWTPVDPTTIRVFTNLADNTNAVIDRFRQTLRLVARSAAALSAGRTGIHDVSEQISSTAESTAGQAADAAAAAEQVSGSVRAMAHSSDGLVSEIGQVAQHAATVLQVSGAATEQGRRAVELVATLQDSSRQIERVVSLIASIAGQTRTLAFNATIEAVRAGAAGSGFAVVAAEVRSLAQTTAEATNSIVASVHAIQDGSGEAQTAIGTIAETIHGIVENQTAITKAVDEQTATTGEIQNNAASVATGTNSIVDSIRTLADAARSTAYAGAQIRTTSGELALIGDDLAKILEGFDTDALRAELAADAPERPAAPTAVVRDGVTWVEDTVLGSGEAEFEYIGDWCHSDANVETGGSNSYNITPDDVVKLRFTGTKVRFYAITGPNHGIGAASVDGGDEKIMDMYSPERAASVLLFESPSLPAGPHVLTIRVTGRWNPLSRYGWVTIDRAEFV